MSEVTLKIAGARYAGWKTIDIRRSMEIAANTFALGATDVWSGQDVRQPVRAGSACEVWIDDERIITGYVDDVALSYNASERGFEISGRSKVADLVDCSLMLGEHEQAQFNNQKFVDIAKRLAARFGVKVKDEVGLGAPSKRVHRMEPGETVFEFLAEYARVLGVRLTSNAAGDLVISRTSSQRVPTALQLGENVLSAQGAFSMRDRFSHYYVVGQTMGWDENYGTASSHIQGKAQDTGVRFRPTVIVPESDITKADAQRRADWQRSVNFGRSQQVVYTVTGWTHANGLWGPNRLVRVQDEWMGVRAWWLLSEVRYLLDERGQRAELTVTPKEAFDLVPLPAKDQEGIPWQ